MGASLLTAKATAEYIKKSGAENVSLVCMGLEAIEPTDEDTLCAEYIKSLILDTPFEIEKEIEKLKYTSGAKFFDAKQNDVFPEMDFHMCTEVDKFNFILRMTKDNQGLGYMEKITVEFAR